MQAGDGGWSSKLGCVENAQLTWQMLGGLQTPLQQARVMHSCGWVGTLQGCELEACLGRRGHLVSPPHKGDINAVLVIFSFVVKPELGIWGDNRNLAHVAQHFSPVVLPVPQNGHTQLGSMPLLRVALLLVDVHMWLISASP